MTPVDLAAIRERAENATPGPWTRNEFYGDLCGPNGEELFYGADGDGTVWARELEDAIFATHARVDVPALLDLVEAFAARIEAVRKLHQPYDWDDCIGGPEGSSISGTACEHCVDDNGNMTPYPCPTIKTINGDQ